jgi:ubiquinone/menaquinone biosynthesis C-methylase UbiE
LLPPRKLRFCGNEFKDDAYYLKSAQLEARRLVERCGLKKESRVLDIGCGPGRLAIGIAAEVGPIASYTGLDVYQPAVDFCLQNLKPQHGWQDFVHLDLANDRYNPSGRVIDAGVRLPVESGSVDVVNLYSVFSHMTYGDVVAYLAEMRRVLAAEGRVFMTAFIEENVPNFSINPPGYREEWEGALHCVRFEREFFADMLGEAGLKLVDWVHARETNGQSALYVAPAR